MKSYAEILRDIRNKFIALAVLAGCFFLFRYIETNKAKKLLPDQRMMRQVDTISQKMDSVLMILKMSNL